MDCGVGRAYNRLPNPNYLAEYPPEETCTPRIQSNGKELTKEVLAVLEERNSIDEYWELYVDGSASVGTSASGGAGVYLKSPNGAEMEYAIRLNFQVTNNGAEYEALLAGLTMAKSVMAKKIRAYTDSQLVALQFDCGLL